MPRRKWGLVGTLIATLVATSIAVQTGTTPSAPDPVRIASVLESHGYTVRGAFSRSEALFDDDNGQLILVRRANDSATAAIPADPATGRLDTAAMAAHCTTNNCFVVTTYNQDRSGNDLTQAATSRQPKIYDGTTGTILIGSLPVSEHISTANTDSDNFGTTTHQLGFAGNPSITIYASAAHSDVTTYRRAWAGVGGVAAPNQSFGLGFGEGTGNLAASINSLGSTTTTARREFTPASAVSTFHYAIAQSPGLANANTILVTQNGVLLTEAATLQAQRADLAGTRTTIGGGIGANNFGIDAQASTELFIEGYVSGAALDALVAFGDSQLTTAGVTPPAHDYDDAPGFLIQTTGQSNAAGLGVPATVPVDYGPHWLAKVAQGGTALDPYWLPEGTGYENLEAALLALDPDVPLVVWRVQGESDAADPALAAAYLTNSQTIYSSLTAALGRPIYWCETLLHSASVATHLSTVNAAKVSFVAWINANGGNAITADPSSHGSLTDGTHWEASLYAAMPGVVVPLMKAAWFPRRSKKRRRDRGRVAPGRFNRSPSNDNGSRMAA